MGSATVPFNIAFIVGATQPTKAWLLAVVLPYRALSFITFVCSGVGVVENAI
jgi:hypothetical protein